MSQQTEKKIAIITGVSSGIGLATTKAFLSAGWAVFGVDISPPPSDIADNASFKFVSVNLTEASAPHNIVSGCQAAYGSRIDALLNIAGIMDGFAGVDNLQDSDWDRVISVNLTAPTRLMREVVKVMKEQNNGSIVNVCSKAAVSGAVSGAAYTASKHGLLGVTKNTAWLYKNDGIRCNAILPGGFTTNIHTSVPTGSWDMASLGKMKPVHDTHYNWREGEKSQGADPALAAEVLLYLASDASKGLNGSALAVDNAWSTI